MGLIRAPSTPSSAFDRKKNSIHSVFCDKLLAVGVDESKVEYITDRRYLLTDVTWE